MDPLSEDVERGLRELEERFWLIIVNLDSRLYQGKPVDYTSTTEARIAMLREAYRRGQRDPLPTRDFDTDVQRVQDYNDANRR